MSCELFIGRVEPCKDQVGGLKNVYFYYESPMYELGGNLPNPVPPGLDADVITNVSGVTQLFKFELKANENNLVSTINSDRNNGTTFFTQVLSLKLKRLDAMTTKHLKLLSFGKPYVIVETNNNQFISLGTYRGMEVTGGTVVSGGALGDHSGYTLTLTGEETAPLYFLNASNDAGLISVFTPEIGDPAVIITDDSLT